MRNKNYLRFFFVLLFLSNNAFADVNEHANISAIWYQLIGAIKKLLVYPFMRLNLFKVVVGKNLNPEL